MSLSKICECPKGTQAIESLASIDGGILRNRECLGCGAKSEEFRPRDSFDGESGIKPPIGLQPQDIWEAQRKIDVYNAICRYLLADKPLPIEWIEEYNERASE